MEMFTNEESLLSHELYMEKSNAESTAYRQDARTICRVRQIQTGIKSDSDVDGENGMEYL
jgi:hypothetical protein